MAPANVSQQKRRAAIVAAPLKDFAASELRLECESPGCPKGRRYLVRELAGMYRDATVGEVLTRLKCQRCGRDPRDAWLVGQDGVGRPSEIRLLGPGAFG